MNEIDPKLLRKMLRYEPDTGKLFWLARSPDMFPEGERSNAWRCANWNSKWAGKEAFTAITSRGYLHGRIFGQAYFAHRVIWALANGAWPIAWIDHRDRNTANNVLSNLREATASENLCNQGAPRTNTSGVKGITWDKCRAKWCAQIVLQKKRYFLGRFGTIEDATAAYVAANAQLHGEFGRLA